MAKAKLSTLGNGQHEPQAAAKKPYVPSELVIKEVMIQKSITREQAIELLKNPTQKK